MIRLFALGLVLGFGATVYGIWYATARRKILTRAGPHSLVQSTDNLPTLKAKQEATNRYLRAMRLLGEVQKFDCSFTYLPSPLRKDIDEAIEDFYGTR